MKKIIQHPVTSLVFRILVIYITLALLRMVFYWCNMSLLGDIESSEIPELIEGALKFDTANICYTFGLFVVWSLLPLSPVVLAQKWYRFVGWFLYALGSFLVVFTNVFDSGYFHYAKKRVTAEEFSIFLGNDNKHILGQAIADNWWMLVLGIVLTAALIGFHRLTRPVVGRRTSPPVVYYTVKSIVFAIAVALLIIGMRGGLGREVRPITLSNAAQYASTPDKASIVLSNPFCILRTMENKPLRYVEYYPEDSLEQYYSPIHRPETGTVMPSQKGKNVVVFILESFSAEHSKVLNPSLYDKSIMPFLDSLMTEGFSFTRAYANGRKSIDALPSVLSSIPSLGLPFATMPAALSPMDGLGSLLKERGYSTWFFNGSKRGSMGFMAYAKLAGVDHFRSQEDYEAAYGTDDYDGFWGIWDGKFLHYMDRELNKMKQPFLASVFTLTSHHPFVVPDEYKSRFPEGRTKVHKCVSYVDDSFRRFFEEAKQQPWYENTVFVFVGDHVSSETFSPVAVTPTGNSHIVYFMYTPDGSLRGVSGDVTQQIDVKPTLLGLLGTDEPYHAFGRDVFARNNSTPPFAVNFFGEQYQWIEGDTAYIFDKSRVTSAYNYRTDSLEQHNISASSDTMTVRRLKVFLQTYHRALHARDFKYVEKNEKR